VAAGGWRLFAIALGDPKAVAEHLPKAAQAGAEPGGPSDAPQQGPSPTASPAKDFSPFLCTEVTHVESHGQDVRVQTG